MTVRSEFGNNVRVKVSFRALMSAGLQKIAGGVGGGGGIGM
jgi:hypothetical protein